MDRLNIYDKSTISINSKYSNYTNFDFYTATHHTFSTLYASGQIQSGFHYTNWNASYLKLQSSAGHASGGGYDYNNELNLRDGRIGILTTSPNYRLQFSNATESKICLYDNTSGNIYGFGVSAGQLNYHVGSSSNSHVWYAGGNNGDGTELMRIQGSGNISMNGDLDIKHDDGSWSVGDTRAINFKHYNSSTLEATAKIASYLPGGRDVQLRFYTANNGTTYHDMTLWDGKLGIGTITPSTELDVNGTTTSKKFRRKIIITVSNPGSGNKYYMDGVQNPILTLQRGYEYVFDLSDSSTNNHPFYITTHANGGDAPLGQFTTGVTGNGNHNGTGTKTIIFAVPDNAPGSLYYQCGNHGGMENKINIDGTIISSSTDKAKITLENTTDEDIIKFQTNNVERMRIDSNGKIGIGVNNPSTYLVVGDDIGINDAIKGIHMKSTSTESKHYVVGQATNKNVFLKWQHDSTANNAYASLSTYGGTNNLLLQQDGGGVLIGSMDNI